MGWRERLRVETAPQGNGQPPGPVDLQRLAMNTWPLAEEDFPLRVTIQNVRSTEEKFDVLMFFLTSVFPPLFAAGLLLLVNNSGENGPPPLTWDRLCALVCYLLHGAWLLYLGRRIVSSGVDWYLSAA